jgi:phosphonate transport system permease protein
MTAKRPAVALTGKKETRIYTWVLVATIALFVFATVFTKFNPFMIFQDSNIFWDFITKDFMPPAFKKIGEIWQAILVTVELAFASTFLSAILALGLAFLGSAATTPNMALARVIRAIASFLRNIPALVWAFILFMSLGIGTSVGFVALVISTFGFLLRAFIETIDETSGDVIEALTASGASFWQKISQAVIPSAISGMIAWLLYCIEVNIRASTIVGMVGGGGVGLVLFYYLKNFQYHVACGIILVIAALVIGIDYLTNLLRKKVLS